MLGQQMELLGDETDIVPLYYHIVDNIQIQFGREEFYLVTGLKFGVEYWADYNDEDEPIPFRRRVFSSALDSKPITGKTAENLIKSQLFYRLHDDDALSLCCIDIWQLVLLGVEDRRAVPDWILRDANVRRWPSLYATEQRRDVDKKTYLIFGFTWAFKTWILESKIPRRFTTLYYTLPPNNMLSGMKAIKNYYDTNVMYDIAKVAGKLQLFVFHYQIDLSTVLIPNDGSLEESFAANYNLEIYIDHLGVDFIIAKYIFPNASLAEMMNHVITNYTSESEDDKREVTQNDYTFDQMVEWAEQEHFEDEETKEVQRQHLKNHHPLIEYGRYALGCMTEADMKKATYLKMVRDELLRSMKEKRQLIKNYKEM
ncbi:hypothetical protein Tco_0078843 [Tanacetum coccineum]